MFGSIGITELILIAGVALMVLGPEKFPEFAKMAARLFRDVRKYATEVQQEITKEIKPVTREFEQLTKVDPERYIDKLIGDDEEDDDDDGSINLEPDINDLDLPPEPIPGVEPEESEHEETTPPAQSVQYGQSHDFYDEYPTEEDDVESADEQATQTPAPETPERLDG